jgi:hypothetical protein
MATITIKIESEELAREVLTQLGYLPGEENDISDASNEEPEEPETKEPRLVTKSSRDEFAEQHIKKVLVDQGLVVLPYTDVTIPAPIDDGFGTPIDRTEDQEIQSESMKMVEREKQADAKRKIEKKEKTQKEFRAAAALMKERLTHGQYLQFLEAHESDPNIDPDIKQVAYQFILKEKSDAQLEATKEAALKDEGYRIYIENVEPISYEDYLKMIGATLKEK